jgi:hypothetical protein
MSDPHLPEGWRRTSADRIERDGYRVSRSHVHIAAGARPIYHALNPWRGNLGAYPDPISACEACDRHAGHIQDRTPC